MKTIFILLFVMLSIGINAQNWHNNFEEAKAEALKENKKILLVFQGTDWCAPCIKLEKDVWETEVFKSYAKENYVLVKAEFPRKKKNALPTEQQEKNNKLAEKYNSKGYFPLVVVFNSKGEVIGEAGYKKLSAEDYIKHLESLK